MKTPWLFGVDGLVVFGKNRALKNDLAHPFREVNALRGNSKMGSPPLPTPIVVRVHSFPGWSANLHGVLAQRGNAHVCFQSVIWVPNILAIMCHDAFYHRCVDNGDRALFSCHYYVVHFWLFFSPPNRFARRSITWTRSVRGIPWRKKALLEALLRWWQPARALRGDTMGRSGATRWEGVFLCHATVLAGDFAC